MKASPDIRVLIVDDHPIFRMGLEALINQEPDLQVCAVAESLSRARAAVAAAAPDMVIVDISLDGDNGLDLVREISASQHPLPILVLSMHAESVWAERAIRAGARGYLMKKAVSESVIQAIRAILQGHIHLSETAATSLLGRFRLGAQAADQPSVNTLTDRELEVFRLLGSGLSTRDIASRLGLSIKTIGTYRDRIKDKLGIPTTADLVRRAVLWMEKSHFDDA
ncbi:Nar family two-component system response regulator [Desulfosarcina cetonica]|uniref:response regulator transcription factor n=1 Tax=Desulfosarcina cetonica TaxID=90730 RepID=UPI001BC47C9D|nr:response regulator transcription factor [Desulfosarcina cetonica]VTR66744.1 Nar family two-component system response regulator [Desulfosarcina cetonica]